MLCPDLGWGPIVCLTNNWPTPNATMIVGQTRPTQNKQNAPSKTSGDCPRGYRAMSDAKAVTPPLEQASSLISNILSEARAGFADEMRKAIEKAISIGWEENPTALALFCRAYADFDLQPPPEALWALCEALGLKASIDVVRPVVMVSQEELTDTAKKMSAFELCVRKARNMRAANSEDLVREILRTYLGELGERGYRLTGGPS